MLINQVQQMEISDSAKDDFKKTLPLKASLYPNAYARAYRAPEHRGGNSIYQSQVHIQTLYQHFQGCHDCPAIQN